MMKDPLYESDNYLNVPLTLREVRDAVQKSKMRKAMGVDNIPNEVLKNDNTFTVLCDLFQLIFDTEYIGRRTKQILRKKHSCSDHIFVLNSIVKESQVRGPSTFATFVDFAKAFDALD